MVVTQGSRFSCSQKNLLFTTEQIIYVALDKGPETFYGGPLPEVLHGNLIIQPLEESDHYSAKISGSRKKIIITLAVLTSVIVITVLAVGIKFRFFHNSHKALLVFPYYLYSESFLTFAAAFYYVLPSAI